MNKFALLICACFLAAGCHSFAPVATSIGAGTSSLPPRHSGIVKSRLGLIWDIQTKLAWNVSISSYGRDDFYELLTCEEWNNLKFAHQDVSFVEGHDCDEAAYEAFVSTFKTFGKYSKAIFPAGVTIDAKTRHILIVAVLVDGSIQVYDPAYRDKMPLDIAIQIGRFKKIDIIYAM